MWQELQQEQTPHQLLSPLPFPTTLPLLSACIAQQKTVVTDPVHYLQAFSHDILYQICCHKNLPAPGSAKYNTIFLVRDLAVSLSSCVYQSLCDSETKSRLSAGELAGCGSDTTGRLSMSAMNDSYLMMSSSLRRVSTATEDAVAVTTEPSKWPGVTALRALLDRDKDDDTPDLTILLCEAYVAIYMSLLVSGLSTCDSGLLYRLVSQMPSRAAWAAMFGGGTKRQLRVETLVTSPLVKEPAGVLGGESNDNNLLSNSINTVTNMTKQRIKLNMKLLNVQLGSSPSAAGQDSSSGLADNSSFNGSIPAERRMALREEFVPPEASILTRILTKPMLEPDLASVVEYDSGGESELEEDLDDYDDDDDPFSMAPVRTENQEHSDPDSYAWAILRLAIINMAQKNIELFLSIAGIEMSELPISSSLIYKCLRISEKWTKIVTERLNRDGKPPDNFIIGCFPDPGAQGPLINKYRSMLEQQNTPFAIKGHGLGPIKRLWRYLVHQERVQPIFIRYIFGKSRKTFDTPAAAKGGGPSGTDDSVSRADEPLQEEATGQLKIIHKDQVKYLS